MLRTTRGSGYASSIYSSRRIAEAQRNFTDPESRILKSKDGFIQGYNTQAAVDGEAQIIVAHTLT